MGKIIELPVHISNQIKAGEVVERPVSVVKELVENAIDANSTQIDVVIEEGGLSRIQVVDNGDGIESEDVLIAFQRHATSKMTALVENDSVLSPDRMPITTLGFRGEALPSIASVSKVLLDTATKNGSGTHVAIEGGVVKEHHAAVGRQGTTIEVRDLFYNTPARLKFISSLQTEVSKIADLMNRLSLSHPEIAFSLTVDGNRLLKTAGNNVLQQTIAGVYTPEIARKMVPLSAKNMRFTVEGYACLPEINRARKNYISIFLNGRYIRNFLLVNAVVDGYGTTLMVGRFPIAVVMITADFELVDVNAHPTKETVRISQEAELIELIKQAINQAMLQSVRIPNSVPKRFEEKPQQTQIAFQTSDFAVDYTQDSFTLANDILEKEDIFVPTFPKAETIDHHIDWSNQFIVDKVDSIQEDAPLVKDKGVQNDFPELHYFGQMHGTYLFAENESGLYIIDQHAAQERIKYEYYSQIIGQVENAAQTLIVPLVLDYPSNEYLQILEYHHILEDIGIYLKPFGQNSFLLEDHPTWIKEDLEATVRELITIALEDGKVSIAKYREDIAIMMSCKKSIKANHHLSDEQARFLLSELSNCQNPYNCPHGRPVLVQLTNRDMEKLFKRIV